MGFDWRRAGISLGFHGISPAAVLRQAQWGKGARAHPSPWDSHESTQDLLHRRGDNSVRAKQNQQPASGLWVGMILGGGGDPRLGQTPAGPAWPHVQVSPVAPTITSAFARCSWTVGESQPDPVVQG